MKTKRLLITALLCVVCAMFGLFAVACNNNEPDEPEATTYIVTFDVQGHGTAPSKLLNVEPGSKITEPTAPTAEGYVFDGWYKENTCTNKWNFASDTVEKDTTLYAKWDEQTYTVKFDVQGKGTAPADVTGVKANAKIKEPTAPTADGFAIEGWYKEKTCETKWDFDKDTVTANTTLYANWVETFTVTFNAQGHGTAPAALEDVAAGSNIDEPAKLSETGFVFEGWYKEATCETKWNFATDTVEDDTTLYAYWKQIYTVSGDPNADAVTIPVSDHAYFTVSVAGQYYISIEHEGNTEGGGQDSGEEAEERDDTFLIDGVERYKQQELMVYLTVGRHTITCTGAAFDAEVELNDIDLPFTETCTYMNADATTEFIVTGTGIYDGEKTGLATVRIDETDVDNQSVITISFDGTYYVLQELEYDWSGNSTPTGNYYRFKVTETQGKITSVELAKKTGEDGEWGDAETLTKAPNAIDFVVNLTATNEANDVSEEVQDTFEYVYFNVSNIKNKWLLFTGIAEGTTFYWVDINDGRTGATISYPSLTINNNESLLLQNDYYDYIAVSPAQGNTVSFTLQLAEVPEGMAEENPLVMDGNSLTVSNAVSGATYYLTYTAEQAGKYVVSVSKGSDDNLSYSMFFTVNATEYGCSNYQWVGGLTNVYPYAEVNLKSGENKFTVVLGDYDDNFTLTVTPVAEFFADLQSNIYGVSVGEYDENYDVYALRLGLSVDTVNNKASLNVRYNDDSYALATDATLTKENGVYTFATVAAGNYETGTVTIKATDNATYVLFDGTYYKAEIYGESAELVSGTYRGENEYGNEYTLVVNLEEKTVKYSIQYDGTYTGTQLAIKDGVWSFTYSAWGQKSDVSFTVTKINDELVLHVIDYTNVYNAVSVSDEDPGTSADLVPGTYSGTCSDNGTTYTLVIEQNRGMWLINYSDNIDDIAVTGARLSFNETTKVWSFDYNYDGQTYTATFTVTLENGELTIHFVDGTINFDATASSAEEATLVSGRYTGTSDSVEYVLDINVGDESSTVTYTVGGNVVVTGVNLAAGSFYAYEFNYQQDTNTLTVSFDVFEDDSGKLALDVSVVKGASQVATYTATLAENNA